MTSNAADSNLAPNSHQATVTPLSQSACEAVRRRTSFSSTPWPREYKSSRRRQKADGV